MPRSIDIQQEREWIAGLHAGRLDVFRAVFETYYPVLQRFVRTWTPQDVAEDIVQDVLFDVWQRRDALEVKTGNLTAYLFSAARNRAGMYLRHQRVHRRVEQDDVPIRSPGMGTPPSSPDTQLIARELSANLRAGIAQLPALQRAVLMLRWTQGMSYAQIATALSISENAAMLHVSKARRFLYLFLNQSPEP